MTLVESVLRAFVSTILPVFFVRSYLVGLLLIRFSSLCEQMVVFDCEEWITVSVIVPIVNRYDNDFSSSTTSYINLRLNCTPLIFSRTLNYDTFLSST